MLRAPESSSSTPFKETKMYVFSYSEIEALALTPKGMEYFQLPLSPAGIVTIQQLLRSVC